MDERRKRDAFNFELNSSGKNGAEFEGGWTPAKYRAFAKRIDQHPDNLKMTREEFSAELARREGQSHESDRNRSRDQLAYGARERKPQFGPATARSVGAVA
ncbi:hypothetical protein BDD14_3457 [Edaphobacter modestus]|uniref:Uncharacterized protein n=1 Tax=Edaphobacter modestus TaxID=388466 RepID=A0A4Q7YXS5_9BACT|nr:hypothetical protein BDD14_3457 [Edaphobacter modestus]